jgi:hypothetical protein
MFYQAVNRNVCLSLYCRYFSAATQLQSLDLSRNLLECIPGWVDAWGPGGFQSLKATANLLTCLPDAIGAWGMCT